MVSPLETGVMSAVGNSDFGAGGGSITIKWIVYFVNQCQFPLYFQLGPDNIVDYLMM